MVVSYSQKKLTIWSSLLEKANFSLHDCQENFIPGPCHFGCIAGAGPDVFEEELKIARRQREGCAAAGREAADPVAGKRRVSGYCDPRREAGVARPAVDGKAETAPGIIRISNASRRG